jgi:FtsH-binding integral membrane protein
MGPEDVRYDASAPASASSAGRLVSRNVASALPVAFLLPVVAAIAAAMGALPSRPRVSTIAIFTVLVATFLAGFVGLTRHRRPRAGLLAACHAVAWVPFIAYCAWQSIANGIVQPPGLRCGTGIMALFVFAVPIGGFLLLAAGIAAGAALAHRGIDGALRTMAFGATGLALVAFAFAVPRITRPDPDTYLASLPIVGEARPESDVELFGHRFRYQRAMVPDHVIGGNEPSPPHAECQLVGVATIDTSYPGDNECPALRVRVDPGHDLVVVDAPLSGGYVDTIAFRPSTGERLGISAVTVADHIGPPIGWTVSAALGGLIGAAFVVAARRVRRRAAALGDVDGNHVGMGSVVLSNGDRLLVDAAAELPVGPVVLGDGKEQLPTYRIMGVPTFATARPGTLDSWRGTLTDLAASLDGVAIAAAALGATPLVVARLVGAF